VILHGIPVTRKGMERPPASGRLPPGRGPIIGREHQELRSAADPHGSSDARPGKIVSQREGGFEIPFDVEVAVNIGIPERKIRRMKKHSSERAGTMDDEGEQGRLPLLGPPDGPVPQSYGKVARTVAAEKEWKDAKAGLDKSVGRIRKWIRHDRSPPYRWLKPCGTDSPPPPCSG